MKKFLAVCLVVGLCLAFAKAGHAWSFGAELKSTVNNKSNSDNDNSTNLDRSTLYQNRYSTSSSMSNSNNRYDNSRTDNSRTDNHAVSGSYNTDNHNYDSHAISDAYNDKSVKTGDYDYSTGKTAGSYNGDRRAYNISGEVSKSVIGDFNQTTVGTQFGGGVTVSGSGNTIGGATSVSNTFGDVSVSQAGQSKQ